MLHTFDRKMLRRIHGPIQDKGSWRPRWNSEIYNLYKYLNIVDDFKTRRLGWWLERSPKKYLMGNFIIQDQWKNQEQDGRTSSGWTHHRS